MAVKQFRRPYDYTPGQTKEVVVGEQHTIPVSPPYDIYLIHIPRKETPSTVRIAGFTEVESEPGPGQFQVHYTEEAGNGPLGRITFNAADAGKTVAVDYHACGTAIWAEDRGDGRPNIAELQEVLERVQEAGGIDYGSSGFANVKAALDALVGVRIVEMGSNSNGEYVRWENGWQVVWGRVRVTDRSADGIYTDTITLAAAFYERQFVAVANVGERGYNSSSGLGSVWYRTMDIATPGSDQIAVRYEQGNNRSSASIPVSISYIAIGRWK